jgi:hypothetical protein
MLPLKFPAAASVKSRATKLARGHRSYWSGRRQGTCGDGEDGDGEAGVAGGRDPIKTGSGSVHGRLVSAKSGGEEPPELIAGGGGVGGVDLH